MSNTKNIDGFNYPLAVVRPDLLKDKMEVPVGDDYYGLPEPLPYRWTNPEDDVSEESDDNFEVYLDGKWQGAVSIDFDFLS